MKSIVIISIEQPCVLYCFPALVSSKVFDRVSKFPNLINMREAIADSIKEQMRRSER